MTTPSLHVVELNDAKFASEVLQSTEPVLVDFTATWCPPCKAIAPSIESLAAEYKGRIKVATMNVDDNQLTAEQYGIRAMPTLLFFKGGKVVKQIVGAVPRAKLEQAIQQTL